MHTLLQDLRYGLRMLLKQKGVTAVALLSLALGIGANTALFSIVDAMLLKMLPVKEPERLVLFKSMAPQDFSVGSYNGSNNKDEATGQQIRTSFPYQTYQRMREQPGPLSDVFAFGGVGLNVNADGQADVASGQAVTGNYFTALGVQPAAGRLLTDEDDKANATPVAVLSHRYWQKRFAGDPAIIGKQINLNNLPFTVIGVSAKGFDGTMSVGTSQDVTIPIAIEPQLYADKQRSYMSGPGVWWLRIMGRLKPVYASFRQDRPLPTATFEVRTVGEPNAIVATTREALKQIDANLPIQNVRTQVEQGDETLRMERLFAKLVTLFALLAQQLAAIGLFGVLAYSVSQRTHEIGIRMALGADRANVMRMIVRQGMVLAVLGVILGLAGAYVLTRYLESWVELSKMLFGVKVSDPWTYGVIAVLLTVVALIACYIPARRATKVDPLVALRYE